MRVLIALIMICQLSLVNAQSIISWTEQNGTLGLGFPVPIPVDTSEPFDGFRTYNGLFAKHQSIALNNNYIQGHIVGNTVYNRDLWAYMLSDENQLTKYGVKEGAMLVNGGIHAREWQSPEVLTGIMELFDEKSNDESFYQYLLENTAIVAIPVNNIDGFLQTQRFPEQNWYSNQIGPRDGRMRRKNLLDTDEDLFTGHDFLLGVDLNRNNSPYWASSNSSSPDETSILHHGPSVESEPETQARLNAAELVDADQVRIYTDVHSFSKVHFSVRTNIANRTVLQKELLEDFTNHHAAFPAGKYYQDIPSGPDVGIGSTDEYFAETYQVPSWTLEIEPGGNGAVEYGGFGNNGHDGFILPESEITRVREQLAESFAVTWYGQAGPPSITQLKIVEKSSGVVVYDASWDITADGERTLFQNTVEHLFIDLDYQLVLTFDKPMRVRDVGKEITYLQGQHSLALNPIILAKLNGENIDLSNSDGSWVNKQIEGVNSYKYYKDDTFVLEFNLPDDLAIDENSVIDWSFVAADMVGQSLDSNPETVVSWTGGQWRNYEDSNGNSSIFGGIDSSYSTSLGVMSKHAFEPIIQPTGLYFDPARNGEGFSYELLSDNRVWIQWFTYDNAGKQRWYSALGHYSGNTITVNNFTQASGGIFGEAFDSANIAFEPFGSLEIIFSGGESLEPAVGFHEVKRSAKVVFTDLDGKKLRTDLVQLSLVKGALNQAIELLVPIEEPVGLISGSWYDPQRSGEGYLVEILEDGRAILIWYTYDLEGNHMWLLDSSGVVTVDGNDITLDFTNVLVAEGGKFGENFNPDDVNLSKWGEVQMQLSCLGSGTVNYSSNVNGFGSGQYNVIKLTKPWVVPYVCDE